MLELQIMGFTRCYLKIARFNVLNALAMVATALFRLLQ